MTEINTSLDFTFQRLREVRLAILRLHKALLNSERVVYEQFFGRIRSSGEFFQLVVNHDWFSWLRPISQFIVEIDEAFDPKAKEPMTVEKAEGFLEKAKTLLRPNREGTSLEKRYYQAIQRDPDIALMHAEVSRLLK
ncbi:hypothetical protein [Oscillatoria sp. FACHB-1406]|uniref:hypothetical protein n=1 Tax=Oscillatoria sp. FACHB-1406 TaxID=2692846 RepID=UPI001682079E|nr:hypothetical protein [Oscillatoria sp. FACHB-1406]MBD2579072.1 hypothetical protein [Oscillatoria sp. FACHB-1406]